jgi:hypothetical protein
MSEESQETHNSGLLYFMPAWIFESKDLSNTEKMVYSLLSGLAFGKESKECFPSDEYIGNRLGISRQQANECVGNLERFGALSKRTVPNEKNPFRKIRFIKIYLENQKSFTKSGKADSRDDEKADSPLSGKADNSNKVYSNKRKNTPISPKGELREAYGVAVRLTKEEYQKAKELCGDALDELIEEMNDYCEAHSKRYSNCLAAIRIWWKKRANQPQKKESLIQANAKWAIKFQFKMGEKCRFEALSAYGMFRGVGNTPDIVINYNEKGFKEQVLNQTRKMGLISFWEED